MHSKMFDMVGVVFILQKEMASTEVLSSLSSANPFMDNPQNPRKKKPKKSKREKQKSKLKDRQSLKDCADVCDLSLWPEFKKKKRKKKQDISSKEEFSLTQKKHLKLSKRHEKNRKSSRAVDTCMVEHDERPGPGEQEAVQTQKVKKQKRVAFNLSPMLIEPKPLQYPVVVRDIFQTQHSRTKEKPSFSTAFFGDGHHSKPGTENGNGTESQSTSDDVNSQDLFITQKTFSDSCVDLCSSTSAEEAPEPQGYKETCLERQSYPASSPWKQSCPDRQPLPKKPPWPAYHPSHGHKLDASTQTENFFTSPLLATSLRFLRQSTCEEEPMDLSLPKRSREGKGTSEGQRHPEKNAADLTPSDDSDSHSKSRADLSQLKVIQTRLNESFFFKLKREVDSPKPTSPLMKFAGIVEKKKL